MPTPRKLGLAGVLVLMLAFALGAFASEAKAAYLSMGTSNTSNATTTLTGSTAGPELKVQNTNGSSASAFGLYGLLTATSPTATSAAVRGANSSTNAYGYGVWGSQAGAGTGVYGFTPSGKGVWGSSTSGTGLYGSSSSGTGARGQSPSGVGVVGLHTSTSGNLAGVEGLTNSSNANAAAVRGVNTSTQTTGLGGYGVWGTYAGYGTGVFGSSSGGFSVGVQGASPVTECPHGDFVNAKIIHTPLGDLLYNPPRFRVHLEFDWCIGGCSNMPGLAARCGIPTDVTLRLRRRGKMVSGWRRLVPDTKWTAERNLSLRDWRGRGPRCRRPHIADRRVTKLRYRVSLRVRVGASGRSSTAKSSRRVVMFCRRRG